MAKDKLGCDTRGMGKVKSCPERNRNGKAKKSQDATRCDMEWKRNAMYRKARDVIRVARLGCGNVLPDRDERSRGVEQ